MRPVAFIALLCAAMPAAQAEEFVGVAQVVDGDSLTVAGRRVRLFGIDAPEYRQTCRVGWSNWACGSDAATALRSMVDGRQLACASRDRDVYGRTVADCTLGGVDVGGAMIDKGLAIALDNAPPTYVSRQARSKAIQAGIWASQFEIPSAFRAANPRSDDAPRPVALKRMPVRPMLARPTTVRPATVRPTTAPVAVMQVARGAFRNCAQARAAGAAPVYVGQPGYGPHLDRDGDGIGCEPYRGR